MRDETLEERKIRLAKDEAKVLMQNYKKIIKHHKIVIGRLEKIVYNLLKENATLAAKIKELESE